MFINRNEVKAIKERFPKGTRVVCDYCTDIRPIESGEKGTVVEVDDIGTVHIAWDNGRRLGLIVGEDSFRKVEE